MSTLASRMTGIVALVLSALSVAAAVYYFVPAGRPKHGLLFAVLFVAFLLFGLSNLRAKKRPAPSTPE